MNPTPPPIKSLTLPPPLCEPPSHFQPNMSAGANYTLSYSGFEDQFEEEPHFLQLCFLCTKPLGHNSDIFMYRGNTPFCSKDCRQEQIEFDEANERSRRLSSAKRSHGKSESNKESAPTGTVAVA